VHRGMNQKNPQEVGSAGKASEIEGRTKHSAARIGALQNENAASIAGLMLTTEALVAEIKEEGMRAAVGAGHGGGMGGMY
jgi:hypothetical protein